MMNVEAAKEKIIQLHQRFEQSFPSSPEYNQTSKELDALYYENLNIREVVLITKNLGHKDTIDDDAKMIVAAANGENVAQVMGLSVEAQAAYKILHARLKKGWTQTELGEKVGLSQSQVAKIETLQQIPDVGIFSKLLTALNTNMSFGVRRTE